MGDGGAASNPSSARHPFRALLPARAEASPDENGSSDKASKKKRETVTAACNACRRRKSKCDAKRPCTACLSRGSECMYNTRSSETHSQALKRKFSELQHTKSTYQEIYDLVSVRPEDEALEIFQRIRAGATPESILRHVRDGDLLLQLALVPETRYRYDLPYLPDMPSFLQFPGNPYLRSPIFETFFDHSTDEDRTKTALIAHGSSEYDSQYVTPYHAAELVEPLLDGIHVSMWTSVTADETLLTHLLRVFFRFQFPNFPYFHKDHFLEDLKAGREDFCSPLLVNAILADACHGYHRITNRAEFWNPSNLAYQFLAEAKRLWELEAGKVSLTTVQAGLLMSLTSNMDGIDKVGWAYLTQVIDMSERLRLFDTLEDYNENMGMSRVITAWGVFSWQALVCFHFFRPPILRKTPKTPLPDPDAYASEYGELYIQYPLSKHVYPTNHGHTVKSTAAFRVILHDLAIEGFGTPTSKGLSLDKTFTFYYRLESWFNGLASPITPQKVVLPCQLKLHMHYHMIVILIFEPFVTPGSATISPTSISQLLSKTPEDIVMEARKSLETAIRLYYIRHGFELYDPLIMLTLSFLGFMSIKELEAPPPLNNRAAQDLTRSTLILAAKGLRDQGRNSFIAATFARMLQSSMKAEDAMLLRRFAKIEDGEEEKLPMFQYIHSEYPIDIVSIADDPEEKRMDNLIKKWERVSLESVGTRSDTDTP